MKNKKKILATAIFAVIIFVVSLITKKETPGYYVSLGDTFVMLAACFLPTGFSMFAALIGCAGAAYLIAGLPGVIGVVIFRVLAACWFMDDEKKLLTSRTAIGIVMSFVLFTAGGYMIEAVKLNDFVAPLSTLYFSALGAIANVVLFLIIAFIFDKFTVKEKINLEDKKEEQN